MSKINLSTITFWLLPLLTISVVAALGVGLIYPWTKDVLLKREEIDERQNQIDEVLQPKLTTLQNLDKEMLRTQLAKLELILPSTVQAPFVFASIESLAAGNNVATEGLAHSFLDKEADEVVNFSFIAHGEFDSLNNFVNALEESTPLLAITSYAQSKIEGEPDSASLAVSSFYKTLPEKVGGVSEPLKAWGTKDQETLQKIEGFKTPPVSLSEEVFIQTIPLGKPNPF